MELKKCKTCKRNFYLLHTHHINGNRENNNSDNLIEICQDCHIIIHKGIRCRNGYIRKIRSFNLEKDVKTLKKLKILREKWIHGKFNKDMNENFPINDYEKFLKDNEEIINKIAIKQNEEERIKKEEEENLSKAIKLILEENGFKKYDPFSIPF